MPICSGGSAYLIYLISLLVVALDPAIAPLLVQWLIFANVDGNDYLDKTCIQQKNNKFNKIENLISIIVLLLLV